MEFILNFFEEKPGFSLNFDLTVFVYKSIWRVSYRIQERGYLLFSFYDSICFYFFFLLYLVVIYFSCDSFVHKHLFT